MPGRSPISLQGSAGLEQSADLRRPSWSSSLDAVFSWVDAHERWVLPLPALVFVTLMLGFPLYYTVSLSFMDWFATSQKAPQFIGLQNYLDMLSDERLWMSLVRTVYFVALAVGVQMVLGVAAALIFHRRFVGQGLARTLFQLSMFATPSAAAMVWMMLYNPIVGAIDYFTGLLGIHVLWMADPNWVIPALVIVDTWQWTPLVMLIILAGLAGLPSEPYEAARIDGASNLQAFWHLTLPLLRPTIIVAAMFRIIDCVKTFDTIMVMTKGGPNYASEILNTYSFEQLFTGFHFGYGSSLLVLLGVIVFSITLVLSRIRRETWYA